MTKTIHEPNKELIGQGIGNSIGALFGGIPGAGATIRTVVNINSGGKTRLSGMIAGLLLLFILLAVGPIASKIPAAVLAGILITVGIGVMDYKGLKAIPYMPRPEVFILVIVLILSSVWNLVYAVGIGLVIASLIFMKKVGDLTSRSLNIMPLKREKAWNDEFEFPSNLKEEVFIKHIEGPLFFGSTAKFTETAKQIPLTSSVLVIRLDKVPYIDQSGLYALESVVMDLIKKNKQVLLVGIKKQPKYLMERIDMIPDLIPENQLFNDFKSAVLWMKENVKDEF
jgi:SulP family sulfate permease